MSIKERLEKAGWDVGDEIEQAVQIDGFDMAVVGVTDDLRLVYDYDKMVLVMMLIDECDELEAVEYIDYNVLGYHRQQGEKHPEIIYRL